MKRSPILVASALLILCTACLDAGAFQDRPGPPPPDVEIDSGEGDRPPGPPQGRREGGPPPGQRPGFGGPGLGGPGGHHGRGPGQGLDSLLNLTEEQKERMRSLRVAFSDKTRAARMTANSLNDEKNNMIASGKIDMKRLAAIDEEIVKARSEVMRAQLQMQRERLSALTEEQIKRLGDLTSRRGDMNPGPGMHHGGHRMGKGRMGGMGGVL